MSPGADGDDPRRVLARHGLAAKKSWGQNFLHDRAVLARIVAAVGATADDVVVEIGAGLGTLTAALARATPPPRRILAIERDPDMQRVLALTQAARMLRKTDAPRAADLIDESLRIAQRIDAGLDVRQDGVEDI